MKDILFLLVIGLGIYVFSRIILKEPIYPFGKKKGKEKEVKVMTKGVKKGGRNGNPLDEAEASPFRELFGHVLNIENHMIRHKDNTFTMIAEVEPVNYFLLDQDEQEGIDATFETWLAQINYSIRIYLQNRFVDLTLPINEIRKTMEEEDDLHPLAIQYGNNMINSLNNWQEEQPRYETKTFLIFDYVVDTKDIKAKDAEELEEKTVNKAFDELYRRLNTAKSQLRKADMRVDMLTTDGISEVLYYGFNRKKARINYYRDIEEKEQLSLYVTADQPASQIIRVKGELEDAQKAI